jgi:TolB-like protein
VESIAPIPAAEVQSACELILTSGPFINAPRLNRLLRFLVEKAISGTARGTDEYAIGIAVFDRDITTYNTREDPIARIQIGRLRRKLKAYYASVGAGTNIEILIPLGSYMPVIRRTNAVNINTHIPKFAIHPFKCISHHKYGDIFTYGLHDELVHQLFKEFGEVVVVHSFFTNVGNDIERRAFESTSRAAVNHRIEGCIQIDAEIIRASIHLFDTSTGHVAWSEQFNRNFHFAIALQQELATSICKALKRFICGQQ